MGKKTWLPGKNLQRFIAATFGVPLREQLLMLETISDAVSSVAPQVREAMIRHPGFRDIGKRMLMAWSEGVQGLRDQRVYAVGEWQAGAAFEGFSAPPKEAHKPTRVGRSPLLGDR
jgi:serine/threonine-protein kinase HipA